MGRGAGFGLRAWPGQRSAAEQGEGDDGTAGQDRGGPPEGGCVAVDYGLSGQLRAGPAMDEGGGGEVGGDGAGEDGVEQGGADRAAELLPVLTVAEATSASRGATPKVPVLNTGAKTRPRPAPMISTRHR
jgi:hypothetical protein